MTDLYHGTASPTSSQSALRFIGESLVVSVIDDILSRSFHQIPVQTMKRIPLSIG